MIPTKPKFLSTKTERLNNSQSPEERKKFIGESSILVQEIKSRRERLKNIRSI